MHIESYATFCDIEGERFQGLGRVNINRSRSLPQSLCFSVLFHRLPGQEKTQTLSAKESTNGRERVLTAGCVKDVHGFHVDAVPPISPEKKDFASHHSESAVSSGLQDC